MDHSQQVKTFVMLGKPGSGKGTQASILSEQLGLKLFSSGLTFRALTQRPDFLGKKIKSIIDHGDLMPYWFAGFIFQEVMINNLNEEQGIVFEGAARKVPEAELIHDTFGWFDRPYQAIYISISDQEAVRRLSSNNRVECLSCGSITPFTSDEEISSHTCEDCGGMLVARADDKSVEIQRHRLEEFQKEGLPVIEFFRSKGTLIEINGEQFPEKVTQDIFKQIKS